MAVGELFRGGGGARSIAEFLSQHQHCDDGFDVHRDAGRVSIACRGCGQRVDYKPAEAGQVAAATLPPARGPGNGVDPVGEAAPPPPVVPPPAVPPPATPPPAAPHQAAPPPVAPPPVPAPPATPPPATPAEQAAPPTPPPQAPAPPPAGPPELGLPRGPVAKGPPGLHRMGGSAKPPAKRRGGLPGWLPIAVIGFLILGGIVLIGIGFLTDAGEQETVTPEPAQEAERPSEQGTNEPNQDEGQQAEQPQQPATPPAAGIDRRTFADRFELGVPAGWDSSQGEGVTLTAPGRKAAVQAFFGSRRGSVDQLADQAAALLRQRHDGARVGRPRPTRIGGLPALRVNAVFRGGEASAIVLNDGGFSYLLTVRIDRGASQQISGQAEAVVQSFRPL